MKPSEVAAMFNVAAGLYPRWSHKFRDDEVMRQWGKQLAPYSVDECCAALEALVLPSGETMPSLAALLTEVRAARHRRQPSPLLYPPAPVEALPRTDFLRESQRRADDYREGLIRQKVRLMRGPNRDVEVTAGALAEIRAWAYEVGPGEAAWIAKHGGKAVVTQPQRAGGTAL